MKTFHLPTGETPPEPKPASKEIAAAVVPDLDALIALNDRGRTASASRTTPALT